MPKSKFRPARGRAPKSDNPPHATSVRLTQDKIDFLRVEAAKRGYFSYKYPGMGAVSRMIADLVDQFFVFVNGQPKKRKKITLK